MSKVTSVKDFDKCCRCCLLLIGTMKPIFTSCLNSMLEQVIGLQITQDDGLPQQMCSRCILKLSSAHTFYNSVKKNHKTLELLLKEGPAQNTFKELPSIDNDTEMKEGISLKTESEELVTEEAIIDVGTTVESEQLKQSNQLSSSEPDNALSHLTHPCPQCNLNVASQEELKNHLQSHSTTENGGTNTKESAHLCVYCGKRFRWRSSLAKHTRYHRGNIFQCKYCDKRYAEASTLRAHLVSHSAAPRPFRCGACGGAFAQRASLRRHARAHAPPAHRCRDCGKAFMHKRKKAFDVHMETHAGKPSQHQVAEATADRAFPDRIDVQRVTVEFLCLLCDQTFRSKESLEIHTCKTIPM